MNAEFEKSRAKLEEISEAHRLALLAVNELQTKLDTATAKVNRLAEQLTKANAEYMELEKVAELEQ